MNTWFIWIVIALIAYVLIRRRNKYKRVPPPLSAFTVAVGKEELFAKTPLNKSERLMYYRLQEALPEYVVLSQVSLGAMMTSLDPEMRSRFDRQTATFVVCTQGFSVSAVVEVEDPMNAPRQIALHEQAKLMKKAGYPMLRYRRIPEIDQVRRDFGLPASTHPSHIVMQRP